MITLGIDVVNGVGEVEIPSSFHGNITMICVKPPANTHPTYSFYVNDQDDFGLCGSQDNQGATTLQEAFFISSGTYGAKISVINANVDGEYTFRLYQASDQ